MSKSSNHASDLSTSESYQGMSQLDSSQGADSPEPMVYVAPVVANKEQKAVARSKFLVFFVLLLAVSGAATATFILMNEEESNNFDAVFAGVASEATAIARQKIGQLFSAVDAYSAIIAAEAQSEQNSSWPFVYISNYSLKSEKISALLGWERPELSIAPVVQEEDKDRWESFVLETAPVWYQESIDNEGQNATVEEYMSLTAPFLHHYDSLGVHPGAIPTTITGPSLPECQRYPLIPGISGKKILTTSFDFQDIREIADLFKISNSTLRPSIGFVWLPDTRPPTDGLEREWVIDSQVVQPIMENGKVVGMVWLRLPWLGFFQNLNVDGLVDTVAVLRSSCEIDDPARPTSFKIDGSNSISYAIDGLSAEFLGIFDAHDP
eukprot:scaffold4628_cov98-Cylindrotheca_fusiformis.AAC.1